MPSSKPSNNGLLWVTAALAGAIFITLAAGLVLFGGLSFDRPVYAALASLRSPWLTALVIPFTNAGDVPVLLPLALALLLLCCLRRRPDAGVLIALNLGLAALFNHLVKGIFLRPRPDALYRLIEETGHSFPSGHSFTSMAFYGLLIYLVWHNFPKAPWRLPACLALGLLILLIGLSRVYLGVHYASDVLAGFCGGYLWLAVLTRVPAVRRLARPDPTRGLWS